MGQANAFCRWAAGKLLSVRCRHHGKCTTLGLGMAVGTHEERLRMGWILFLGFFVLCLIVDRAMSRDIAHIEANVERTYAGLNWFHPAKDIRTLTPEVAEVIALSRDSLFLDSLNSLAPDVARALATCKESLSLNGLPSLSDDVATALARHKGTLSLNGLSTLSPDVAVSLANCEGILNLNGLKALSCDVGEALAQDLGFLVSRGPKFTFR